MKIFLVGFMGAGKTTIGRRLANRLGYEFYDTDLFFEDKYHFTIQRFFDQFGEDKFRELEKEVLHELINLANKAIISTGGGTPCFFDNMEVMNNHGLTVYIMMKYGALRHRLLHSKKRRPGVQQLNETELMKYIEQLMKFREEYYKKAHISIVGENCNVTELSEMIQKTIESISDFPGEQPGQQ